MNTIVNKQISSASFTIIFLNFITQAIKGSILPFYDNCTNNGMFYSLTQEEALDSFHDLNSVPLLLINYINYCWHSFHKKNDDYVIEKITAIQSQGGFNHVYCTFDFIWQFSDRILIYILGRIEISMLQDRDMLSKSLDIMLDAIMAIQCDDLLDFEGYDCDKEKCETKQYKEDEDFIKVKILSI